MRSGESTKESVLEEGYASEADEFGDMEGESAGEGDGVGSGCWIDSDGRESLYVELVVFLRGTAGILTEGLLKKLNGVLLPLQQLIHCAGAPL